MAVVARRKDVQEVNTRAPLVTLLAIVDILCIAWAIAAAV